MIRLIVLALALLVLPCTAFAVTEIPCNGVDDDSSGGDADGPAGDADCDGYCASGYTGCPLTGVDANDTNSQLGRDTYPGAYVTCGTDGTRLVNADGTYEDCVEGELCEATGSGVCYYIDPVSGNNSNNGLTRATAWADQRNFSYYNSGAPGTSVYPIANGSVVYFLAGTHTYTTDLGGNYGQFWTSRASCGTGTGRCTIAGYPGAHPVIKPLATAVSLPGVFNFQGSSNWTIRDLIVDGADLDLATGEVAGVKFSEASNLIAKNLTIRNVTSAGTDNVGGFRASSATNWYLENSSISDTIGDEDGSGGGGDNNVMLFRGTGEIIAVRAWNTAETGASATQCWKQKHSDSTSTLSMEWNIWANCNEGEGWGSSGGDAINITNERYYNPGVGKFANWGGPHFPGQVDITYSSFYNVRSGSWLWYNPARSWEVVDGSTGEKNICTGGNFTIEQFTATNNVVHFEDGTGKILDFWEYGPDYFYTNVILAGLVRLDNNKYEGTIEYGISNANDGNTACTTGSERGALGNTYGSLATAQAFGYIDESGSANGTITWADSVNLTVNASLGFQPPTLTGDPTPTPTPTSTPTATPTATPSPSPTPTPSAPPPAARKGQGGALSRLPWPWELFGVIQ